VKIKKPPQINEEAAPQTHVFKDKPKPRNTRTDAVSAQSY